MKRWPVIRHVRAIWLAWRVGKHYRTWAKLGMLPSYRYHDDEMLRRIWRGEA